MKRIIEGTTYNTNTSTRLASWSVEDDEGPGGASRERQNTIYQTRRGAFFIHRELIEEHRDNEGQTSFDPIEENIEPLSWVAAAKLVDKQVDAEIFVDGIFDDPPDAEGDGAAGMTLYVRMPLSLKERIERIARVERVSINTWAMRCLERCLAAR